MSGNGGTADYDVSQESEVMDIIQMIAQAKQYMFYGATLAYPFLTAFTAIGVAKVAFAIPWQITFVLLLVVILLAGITAFRIGLYGKDNDIAWANTPMAKDLCDRVKRIEKTLENIQ